MESKTEMEIIQCDGKSGMWLIGVLETEPKCSFCGKEVTEDNFGGVFSKPTRVCCNNICCLSEAIPFEG